MRPKSASFRSCQRLTTVMRSHKSNKCGGALVQITLQLHAPVHALSTFAESSSLCRIRLFQGTQCCSLLQAIYFASLILFLLFCLLKVSIAWAWAVPGRWVAACLPARVQHRASTLQLPAEAVLLLQRELLSCKNHSSWKNISHEMRNAFLTGCRIIWIKMCSFILSCILILWAAASQHGFFSFSW